MANQLNSMFGKDKCQQDQLDDSFYTTFINQNDGFIPYSLMPDPDDPGSGGGTSDPPPLFDWINYLFDNKSNRRISF